MIYPQNFEQKIGFDQIKLLVKGKCLSPLGEERVENMAFSNNYKGTLYNTYSFFALYANVDGFDAASPQIPVSCRPEIDRWIISLLNTFSIYVHH